MTCLPFLCTFFNKIQNGIQPHCDHAQDYDGHQYPRQLKRLGTVDDQVSKSLSCTNKFSDDHAYQAEPDIYLHNAEDQRNRRGQHDLGQLLFFSAAKGFDKLQLFRVSLAETGLEIDHGAKDSHRHACNNDGADICAQPYNKKWCKG